MCKRYINTPDTPPSPALGEVVGTTGRSPLPLHPLVSSSLGSEQGRSTDQEAGARSGGWADSAGKAVVFKFFFFGFLFFSQHFVSLITYTMVTSHIHNKSYS